MPDGEADLATGRRQRIGLVDLQRVAGDEVVEADDDEGHAGNEQARVHEHAVAAP